MINLKNEKRNQAMSLRGRAVGSDVVIFHAETGKALSFLRLRGASGAQGKSTPALCLEAHKRRFILNQWLLRFANAPLRMTIPVLAFIFTLATTSESSAETWDCGEIANTVSCSLDDNGVFNISGTGKMKDYEYNTIPWGSANIQTVTIGTGVTSIGEHAFDGAKSLTSITIPEGVTSIGMGAFAGTSSLTSITIPDSVTSIGRAAFRNASSLTSITIPEGVTSIEWGAFWGASSLESITIPDSVTSIGSDAFAGASNLTSITLPEGLTSIGSEAFASASSLESITIPEGVTSIGQRDFEDAKSLTSITIPNSVTYIGNLAFADAKSLTSITIPDSVTSIGDGAFWGASSLTSITIPDSVTSIGASAFRDATGLTSITIPEGVTSIGWGAFNGASSLTSITIPDSVTSIGDWAFAGASSLTNIMCKGDETSCAATVNALREKGYKGNISYPTDKTSCEGSDISLFVWDGSKCGRRNEVQCNSVAKYYYSDGKCQVLPKTQSACTGTNIEWNATDNKCVNKNYTPSQEVNNGNTGGDDIGDVSGDFNPADCYNNGQVPYNNQCLDEYPFAKKRWTPAEANEWLHDGNDNFVVITFKK